jgi:hypothetical protein
MGSSNSKHDNLFFKVNAFETAFLISDKVLRGQEPKIKPVNGRFNAGFDEKKKNLPK